MHAIHTQVQHIGLVRRQSFGVTMASVYPARGSVMEKRTVQMEKTNSKKNVVSI